MSFHLVIKAGLGTISVPASGLKICRLKRDITDLNTVRQAVFRKVIRVKLRDGGGRDGDGRQIIRRGEENNLRGEFLVIALIGGGGFLRRDEFSGQADRLLQLLA